MVDLGHLEWLVKSRNGRFFWVNANGGRFNEPYFFDTYQDALKVQKEFGGEILSAKEQGYSYVDENKQVKNESLEITGTWEPHPEVGKSYAYRVKHGLGGGTLPNDVKIKKYEELNNGWVIVYLDRPLTVKELDFYDIPSETISMPEIDKFIDYKCMQGESKKLEDIGYDYWGPKGMEPFEGKAFIQFYDGPRKVGVFS